MKIINDPVYGFITLDAGLVTQILAHPYFQRLRRIQQMALANLIYPGAVHTRLHHALGAYHLMGNAIQELRLKGQTITQQEEEAAKCAILLHDVGHGPYSHALEQVLLPKLHHEKISLLLMQRMNQQLNGKLQTTVELFTNTYPKTFLHQLISHQLDVDRMDYLTRDSFFTGVSEGVIGYDRIIKMLTVHDNQLAIEEKGIYSVEKFLIARRQMYWQVYLHKNVLAAEKMLVKIIERAKQLYATHTELKLQGPLHYFFEEQNLTDEELLNYFVQLDDTDVMAAIKQWQHSTDKVLQKLCYGLLNRDLLKCKLQTHPFPDEWVHEKRQAIQAKYSVSEEESYYLLFTGEATNTTYALNNERINICLKNGQVVDISEVDNPLISQTLSTPIKKFYLCELV